MSIDPTRRKPAGLGRGLSALMGEIDRISVGEPQGQNIRMLSIADIKPHPEQPRRHFDEDKLDELAQSISARVVLQPIVLRRLGTGYQIVASERRWRASQRAREREACCALRRRGRRRWAATTRACTQQFMSMSFVPTVRRWAATTRTCTRLL